MYKRQVWHSTYLGGITDGWVARISDDATSLIASTFVGTNNYDQCFFVETDDGDNIYFTGQTKGAYPVTPGVYSEANAVSYTHLRAHETVLDIVCRLLLEKKTQKKHNTTHTQDMKYKKTSLLITHMSNDQP